MQFFIETIKPHNFSYYSLRIDSKQELKEIILGLQTIHSNSFVQLILRSNTLILICESHGSKAAINVYENLETKPFTEVIDRKIDNITLSQCYSFFIASYAFPFVVLQEDDYYLCLSRVENDLCNMYGIFFVNGGKKEQIMKIISNPSILLSEYEKTTDSMILTDNQKKEALEILEVCCKENKINRECVKDEKCIESEYICETTSNGTIEHQIIEIEPELNLKNEGIEMTNNTDVMASKTFKQLTSTQKRKMNMVLDDLKMPKNNKFNKVEVNGINDEENIVRYGRLVGNKLAIETKRLDYTLSIENYKQLKAILLILIVNMKINDFDIVEVRSNLDVFIMKCGDDILVLMHDQVTKADTGHIQKICKLRAKIQEELKELQ